MFPLGGRLATRGRTPRRGTALAIACRLPAAQRGVPLVHGQAQREACDVARPAGPLETGPPCRQEVRPWARGGPHAGCAGGVPHVPGLAQGRARHGSPDGGLVAQGGVRRACPARQGAPEAGVGGAGRPDEARCQHPPNKGLQTTAHSLRSCLAPAMSGA